MTAASINVQLTGQSLPYYWCAKEPCNNKSFLISGHLLDSLNTQIFFRMMCGLLLVYFRRRALLPHTQQAHNQHVLSHESSDFIIRKLCRNMSKPAINYEIESHKVTLQGTCIIPLESCVKCTSWPTFNSDLINYCKSQKIWSIHSNTRFCVW